MAFSLPQPPYQLFDRLFPGLDFDHPMTNKAQVRSRALTLESDFDLMIGDPLP
jgi:hypothetical protein